jgi:uncharacterized protein YkwD
MKVFLTAAILALACAMFASGALAAGTGAARRHGKHARVSCTATAKSKRHHKHATKHPHRCVRAKHVKSSHSTGGARTNGKSSRTGKRTKQAQPAPRTQPASHQSSRPKETTVSAAPLTALTIAKVLGATCENTELMPEAGNLEAVDQATLCLVNQERAHSGELPLRPNADLTQAAEGHSEEMAQDDYFAHVSPSGETPFQRIEASGYIPNDQVGYTLGENIAWGTLYLATPKAIVAAWIASPEHLANILNTSYTETGLGVTPAAPASLAEGQAGAIYSQEFGVIEG